MTRRVAITATVATTVLIKSVPVAREVGPGGNNSALTEAQRGGYPCHGEQGVWAQCKRGDGTTRGQAHSAVEQVEASSLIDHLRSLLPERSSEPQGRETTFKRANTR
jgi:phage/plasmid primase-like uncharacterized protein